MTLKRKERCDRNKALRETNKTLDEEGEIIVEEKEGRKEKRVPMKKNTTPRNNGGGGRSGARTCLRLNSRNDVTTTRFGTTESRVPKNRGSYQKSINGLVNKQRVEREKHRAGTV